MKSRLGLALTVSTLVVSAGLLGATAYAQQQPNSPAPSASENLKATPSNAEQTPNFSYRIAARGRALAMFSRLSPQDRAAMLDASLAALKAGLELTADQEKLWTPLEQTVRDGVAKAIEMRQKSADQPPLADPMQRLSRISEMATARADFLHRFVDAAQPLYASLSPDQKHRLSMLTQSVGGLARAWGERGNGRAGMMSERMREHMRQWMQEWMRGGENGQRMGEGMRERQGDHQDGWRRGDQDGDRSGRARPQDDDDSGDGQE